MNKQRYSLRQLNMMVRDAIEMQLPDEYRGRVVGMP